jgi:hypothetical protein
MVVESFQHWMQTEDELFQKWLHSHGMRSRDFIPCISAIAFSPQGKETLKDRYGFNEISKTNEPEPHSVFICSLTKEDAKIRIQRDNKLLMWLINREKSKDKHVLGGNLQTPQATR